MITIDSRVGSKELLRHMPKGKAELGRLEFGDAMWIGNGAEGMPWRIGVERKVVGDIVASMQSGRLCGHQLPGMHELYNVVYLVVEGMWRANDGGVLEVYKGNGTWEILAYGGKRAPVMSRDLWAFLCSLTHKEGVTVVRTYGIRETADVLGYLHYWWTSKEWDEHRSTMVPYQPEHVTLWRDTNPVYRVAASLTAIGHKRAKEVAKVVPTVEAMVGMGVKEWQAIEGIGKVIAAKAWEELHGKDKR